VPTTVKTKPTVTFVSRMDFIDRLYYFDRPQCALISISDNVAEQEEMKELCGDLVESADWFTVSFQDVDHSDGNEMSAAVAKFVDEYYAMEDAVLEHYTIYNKLVYNRLKGTLGQMSLEEYYTELEQSERK
jgi:hypothetical protein